MAEKKKFDFKTMNLSDIPKFFIALFKGELGKDTENMTTQTGFYEINLVPDVKSDMIKAQKTRNLVFFICIVVMIASVSAVGIFGSIKGAQDLTMSGQDSHLANLSKKIIGYEELAEFLTLQNQINGISKIEDSQKVLSRAVLFLNALIPSGADTVEVSELSIDLNQTTLAFDAQANAGKAPDIDYRVLESFIKRTNLMTFDYGRYVDKEGNEIPSRCIEEYDTSGKMYEESGSIYAIWKRGAKGCDPGRDDYDSENDSVVVNIDDVDLEATLMVNGESETGNLNRDESERDNTESKVIEVVPSEKIYRTPQFTDWYAGKEWDTAKDGIDDIELSPSEEGRINITNYKYTPEMTTSGEISGIPHFESKCIIYEGEDTSEGSEMTAKWSATNECQLVPEGITVTESSNGRDADDNLVLRFTASVQLAPEAFAFRNKHVMAIGPNGQNVTDSYVQLEKIFAAPAEACEIGDTECQEAVNSGGGI